MSDPADHFISPKYCASKASPGTFPDWVDIYEDRTWGWHLAHAEALRAQGHDAVIAALQLAIAFVEPYEVFRRGESSEGRSKEFFKAGFARIFNTREPPLSGPMLEAAAEAIYKQVRCGLFHAAMPGTLVYLSNATPGIQVQVDQATRTVMQIVLNPEHVVESIITEFRSYVSRLRDHRHREHPELKDAFERAWHLVHRRP